MASELEAGPEDNGKRVDLFISEHFRDISRSEAGRLCDDGLVTVNDRVCVKSRRLKSADVISFDRQEPVIITAQPEPIPLDIVYEDDDLLVVNKPRGMVVHPAPGNYDGTLVNALMSHCRGSLSGINGVIRPGIVHRIDKNTSGLLIVAKNDIAHIGLAEQIRDHSFKREYRAVVSGSLPNEKDTIDIPLGRSPKDRKKQAVNGLNAKRAVTHYEVIERYRGYTYCKLILETGRTHQIRVHLAYIGHPVAGDTVYGGSKNVPSLGGQCLHAAVIGFVHPVTGEYLEFEAPLPEYFKEFLSKLVKE